MPAKGFVAARCCSHEKEKDCQRIDGSGGFDVIGFGNDIKKAFTISLDLNRTHSPNVLKGNEGTWATHGEFCERPIREYNIWGHVFLAGDCRANRLEAGQQALFIVGQ